MRILSHPVHRTFIVRSLAVLAACSGVALTASPAIGQVPQPPSASPPGAFVVDTDQLAKVAAAVVPTPPPAAKTASPTAATATSTPTPAPVVKKTAKAKAVSTGLRLLEPQSTPTATAATAATIASPPEAAPAGAGAGGAIAESVWAALRKCESNGNYAINTGNGYYGAYQFAASTWRKLGFTGLPHVASAATQDQAARKLQAQQGWGPWPACTRNLGLR